MPVKLKLPLERVLKVQSARTSREMRSSQRSGNVSVRIKRQRLEFELLDFKQVFYNLIDSLTPSDLIEAIRF